MEFFISQNAKNVYYADVHIINGKGCFFTGSGKSECGRLASSNPEKSIYDSVGLTRIGQELFAYYDPIMIPAMNKKFPDTNSLIKIENFIFCFTDQSTESIFKDNKKEILECGSNEFVQISKFNICLTADPLGLIKGKLGDDEYYDLIDENKRGFRFIETIDGVINAKYIGLPWMDSIEEKAKLLQQTIV
ncbi:hypothetical protein [Serratia symbiotica]|uniref:hypothetical protein n=1 Tax=Serratia symbiotica TaxID=138074 RepID=UPI00132C5095|nr:hypothetical protein [Serratia symbiotica]QTP14788.1 hypothetical protein GPZ83_0001785 [Serratia symbiotica]